jgi:hypothetical protein
VLQVLLESVSAAGSPTRDAKQWADRLVARLMLWKESERGRWGESQETRSYGQQLLYDRSGSHLMEKVIQLASPDVLSAVHRSQVAATAWLERLSS